MSDADYVAAFWSLAVVTLFVGGLIALAALAGIVRRAPWQKRLRGLESGRAAQEREWQAAIDAIGTTEDDVQ